MAIWAAALALVLDYLQRMHVSRVALWSLLAYFSLYILIWNYTMALVKDPLFRIFVVLLAPILLVVPDSLDERLADSLLFCVVAVTPVSSR